MNYAIVNNQSLVINIIEWDGIAPWQPPAGCIAIATDQAGVGWGYVNGQFTPPPEPPPGPPPLPPSPDYLAFWDALITSSVYESIRTQSMASLAMNTLATEFIALITDAKIGRPNQVAIQNSINAILGTGTFTQEDLEEFETLLVAGNLNEIYSLS